MTIENIWGAFVLLLLPLFFMFIGLFLVGVFQWLGNLSKPIDEHVPFWKPFTDVVVFFKEPSTDLGWLPNLLFILALAVPVFLVWLLPFVSVPTMAVHGDLLVMCFGLLSSTLLMDVARKVLTETSGDNDCAWLWTFWAADLSLILVAFAVAGRVGSLKLTDIVNVQWTTILSSGNQGFWSFKDWLFGKLPFAASVGIFALAFGFTDTDKLKVTEVMGNCQEVSAGKYAGMALLTCSLNMAVRLVLYSLLFLGPGSVLITTLKALMVFVPAGLFGILISFVSSPRLIKHFSTLLVVASFVSLVLSSL